MTELQNCSGVPLRPELSTYINEMAKHVENIINVFKDEGSIPSGSTILNAYRIQNNVWIIEYLLVSRPLLLPKKADRAF